jgi:hypothetical protein
MKNILAENMRRFGTKNLAEQTKPSTQQVMELLQSTMIPNGAPSYIEKDQLIFVTPKKTRGYRITYTRNKFTGQANEFILDLYGDEKFATSYRSDAERDILSPGFTGTYISTFQYIIKPENPIEQEIASAKRLFSPEIKKYIGISI